MTESRKRAVELRQKAQKERNRRRQLYVALMSLRGCDKPDVEPHTTTYRRVRELERKPSLSSLALGGIHKVWKPSQVSIRKCFLTILKTGIKKRELAHTISSCAYLLWVSHCPSAQEVTSLPAFSLLQSTLQGIPSPRRPQ